MRGVQSRLTRPRKREVNILQNDSIHSHEYLQLGSLLRTLRRGLINNHLQVSVANFMGEREDIFNREIKSIFEMTAVGRPSDPYSYANNDPISGNIFLKRSQPALSPHP